MKAKCKFVIGAFFLLIMAVCSCDTFKDEMTPERYIEAVKSINGNWQLSKVTRNDIDITESMDFGQFHILLKQNNTYELNNYLPFIVKKNGTWNVDDPQYPFHLIFNEEGSGQEIITEINYLIVDGERQLRIKLSPGCYTNKYVYIFKQVRE